MTELLPIVAEQLREHDAAYRAIACEPEYGDVAGLCEQYGYKPEEITNTLLVAGKTEPPTFAACVVLATYKLDVNKTVSSLLSVKRGRVAFATAEQTPEVTGMMVGGVTVYGLPPDLPVFVDAQVMACDEVLMGGGNLSSKLILSPSELEKLPNVKIVSGLGLART